ncbi:hypothetical protein BOX15_Mlig000298g2, partial [Macrostomum lignano]
KQHQRLARQMSASDSDSSSMLLGAAAASLFQHGQPSPQPQQCFVCRMRFTYSGFLAHLQSDTHRENLDREHRLRRTDWSEGSGSGASSFKRPDPSELRLSPRLLADSDDSRFGRHSGKGGGSGSRGAGSRGGQQVGHSGGSGGGDRVRRLLSRDADRHRRTEALLAETASKIRQFRQERQAATTAGLGSAAPDTRPEQRRQDRRHRPEPVGDAADAAAAAAAAADSGASTCRTFGSAASATSSLLTPTSAAAAAAAAAASTGSSTSAATSTAATTTTVTPLETVRSEFETQQPSQQRSLTKLLRDAAVLTDSPPTPSAPPSSRRSDSATQFPTPRDEQPPPPQPPPPQPPPQFSPQRHTKAPVVAFEAPVEDGSSAAAASPTSLVSSARRSRQVERMQAALELSLQEDELEAGIEEVDGRIGSLLEQIEQLRAAIEAEEGIKQQLVEKKGALTQRRVAILKESFQIPEDAVLTQFADLSPRPSQYSPFQPPCDSTPRRRHQLEVEDEPDNFNEVANTPRQPPRLLDGVEVIEAYDEEIEEDVENDNDDDDNDKSGAVTTADEDEGNSTDTVRHQLVQKVLQSDQLAKQQQPQSVDSPRDAELINSTLSRLLLPQSGQPSNRHQPNGFQEAPPRPKLPSPPHPPAEVLSDVLSSRSRRSDPQAVPRPASAAAVTTTAVFPGNRQQQAEKTDATAAADASSTNASSASSDAGTARAASAAAGGGGSFRRAASETQLRRSRPRRQDPEFAAALREYLHASSSSDVDLDETRRAKRAAEQRPQALQPLESAKPPSRPGQLSTAKSLDSSSTAKSFRSGAAGAAEASSSASSAPGLVFPGRISAADDAADSDATAGAVLCAAVQQGYLFTAGADGAVRRYSLRTHRCLTVYREPSAGAEASTWLLLTSTAEPLLFFAEATALVGHDVRTGARMRLRQLESAPTAACLRWGSVYAGCENGRVVKYDVAADSVRTIIDSVDEAEGGAVVSLEAALQQPGGRRVLLRGCRATPDLLVADERTGKLLARLAPCRSSGVALDDGPALAIRVAPGGDVAFVVNRRRLLAHRISFGESEASPTPIWELPAVGQAEFTCLHLGLRCDWLFAGQSDGSVLCFCLDQQQQPQAFPDVPTVRLTPSTSGSAVTTIAFYDVGRHVVSGDASGCLVISDSLPVPLPAPPADSSSKVPMLNLGLV